MKLLSGFGIISSSLPKPGMVLLKPTSIANSGGSASVGTNGQVTFSAVTSISLNGVFSATYDNYVIAISWKPSINEGFLLRLRASGTDNTTASSYVSQGLYASSTSISASRMTNTYWFSTYSQTSLPAANILNIYGPFLAQPTAIRGVSAATVSSASMEDYAGTHNQSTSYDGITIYSPAALTGKLTVYGIRG